MEGFLIQRWAPVLPECGGWLYGLYEPQPINDQQVGLGFPQCGTVLTQEITDCVPGVLGLEMY